MKRTFLSTLLCILALPLIALDTNTELVQTDLGYKLIGNGFEHTVKPHDLDSRLRSLDQNQLKRLAQVGCLRAHRMNNGDYRVEIGGGLKGGGIIGTAISAFLGKAAVSIVGHGSIVLISSGVGLFCPPAGWATGVALESWCGPFIEAASIKGAMAGGVIGMVATGPV